MLKSCLMLARRCQLNVCLPPSASDFSPEIIVLFSFIGSPSRNKRPRVGELVVLLSQALF